MSAIARFVTAVEETKAAIGVEVGIARDMLAIARDLNNALLLLERDPAATALIKSIRDRALRLAEKQSENVQTVAESVARTITTASRA